MNWLDQEIQATRTLMNGDRSFYPNTAKQRQKLAILFREAGIESRALRIGILQEWTGHFMISSSKDLTLHTTSVMIDYLNGREGGLSFDGLLFITSIKERAKTYAFADQGEDDEQRDDARMPDLWETAAPW